MFEIYYKLNYSAYPWNSPSTFTHGTIFRHIHGSHTILRLEIFWWNSLICLRNLRNELYRIQMECLRNPGLIYTCCCQSTRIVWCPITADRCPAMHDSNSVCYVQPNLCLTISKARIKYRWLFVHLPLIIRWTCNGIILMVNNCEAKINESDYSISNYIIIVNATQTVDVYVSQCLKIFSILLKRIFLVVIIT